MANLAADYDHVHDVYFKHLEGNVFTLVQN